MIEDLTGKTLGSYQVISKLGQGGMGVVYKAHEQSLNRVVALKIIGGELLEDESFIKRFQREAQTAAQINHPNIVQIYAIGEDRGLHFFAMEFVKGRTVQEILRKDGKLAPARAVPIIRQVTDALSAAHEAGIVHRDIKPANILIDKAKRVKVMDFGIAHIGHQVTRLTRTGYFVGTPEYISPEQCEGKDIDGRTDIYSLGVTFYEMLAGKTPFQADTPAGLIRQICFGEVAPVRRFNADIPEEVERVVARMMEKDRDRRFQSAEELMEALEALPVEAGGTGAVAGPSVPDETVPVSRAHAGTDVSAGETVVSGQEAATVATSGGAAADASQPTVATSPAGAPPTQVPPTREDAPPARDAVSAAEPTAATRAAEPQSEPAPSPAAGAPVAKAAPNRSNVPLLAGLAATVLLLLFIGTAGWWYLGNGADTFVAGGDEVAGSEAGATGASGGEEPTSGVAGDPEAGSGESGVAGTSRGATEAGRGAAADAGAADSGTQPAGAGETGGGANTPTGAGAAAGAGAEPTGGAARPNDVPRPAGEAGRAADTGAAAGTGAAAAGTEAEAGQPAATQPAENTIVSSISGQFDYAEMFNAWIEQELSREGFDVIDGPSVAGRPIREIARVHVVTTVNVVSQETLRYFGESTVQYTVALTMRAVEPAGGGTLAGPVTRTVRYTALNADQNLRQAANSMSRELARALKNR